MCSLPCRSGLVPEQPGDPDRKRGLVVLPIDPYRVHVYWTIGPSELREDDPKPATEATGATPILRFHRIPDASMASEESVEDFEVPVEIEAPNWYVQLPKPSGRYLVELGHRAKDGEWQVLARSATVQTPPASPSEKDDERLMLVMGDFLLLNPFPEYRSEHPAQALSPPRPVAVSGLDAPSAFNADSPEPPLPLAPPERQALAQSAGERDGAAHTGPGFPSEGPKASTAMRHQLEERKEGSFAGGLSSIQLGAGRRTH